MKKLAMFLTSVFFLIPACRGYIPPRYDPALYPHTYKHYDLTLFWKADHVEGVYAIAGFIKNTRYAYIRDLELSASLLDERGKGLAKAHFFFIPTLLPMDELAPFDLSLSVKPGDRPAKIRFFYRYHLAEGDYGDIPYFYSFETDIR
jgi:hypothetical protein